jgi:uncharacterized membrane protein YphA (DoxX/SURF4 family)
MRILLIIGQIILAGMYGMAGFMKFTTPFDQLSAAMPWALSVGEFMTRFIGLAELLGAVGLVLPGLLRISPKLVGYAALGLMVVQILAIPLHLSRGESSALMLNVPLLYISVFVFWGRTFNAPIASRSREIKSSSLAESR